MKKIILNGFCLLIALLSGISLFVLKYHVKAEEKQLKIIHREILQNKREIHMLEAEWAYLNDPQRLLALVESQTDWKTIAPHQIITLTAIPMRTTEPSDKVEIIATEPEEKQSPKPAPVQKALIPMNKAQLNTTQNNIKTSDTPQPIKSETKTLVQSNVSNTPSTSAGKNLDALAQNAKTLGQKPNNTQQSNTRHRLTGTSQKDFVWSAPKKQKKTNQNSYNRGRR